MSRCHYLPLRDRKFICRKIKGFAWCHKGQRWDQNTSFDSSHVLVKRLRKLQQLSRICNLSNAHFFSHMFSTPWPMTVGDKTLCQFTFRGSLVLATPGVTWKPPPLFSDQPVHPCSLPSLQEALIQARQVVSILYKMPTQPTSTLPPRCLLLGACTVQWTRLEARLLLYQWDLGSNSLRHCPTVWLWERHSMWRMHFLIE